MSLTGIAAILALLGIPVSVLVARWQMRTALAQAEAGHRTALAQAEANHRAAMEVAEASHRNALEVTEANCRNALAVAREPVKAERDRWMFEARRAEYRYFQVAVDQLRRALLNGVDRGDLWDLYYEVHDSIHRVAEVGPEEVTDAARVLLDHCYNMPWAWPASAEQRRDRWETTVSPLRMELDEAIHRAISGQETPRQGQRQPQAD